ncbi:carboxypeptidase-like regulatory domain-containing protein [Allomuricauda sp. d1]|uniref:carboxypeptidase-like regulatory domain-containing protein n=1 Tax=Allomuricauda sp. d1 TaxID=3136725 RepID=UPI0031D2BE65
MVRWSSENSTHDKIHFSVILLLFYLWTGYAQHDFKGKIIDAATQEPIPYVNIGIVEEGVGTVSNEEGIFHLPIEIDAYDQSAIIQFSSLGYKTLKINVQDIPMVYNEYPILKLVPEAFQLNEVIVSDKKNWTIPENVGYHNYGEEVYGYWKDEIALGGELATKIVAKSGIRKLKSFEFEVFYNPSDSLLLRVNIYDNKNGYPNENLNRSSEAILYTLKKNEKNVVVDLSDKNIYVNGDFYVALELLKVYGDEELGLVLAAVNEYARDTSTFNRRGWDYHREEGHGSFRRYVSQDKWKRISDLNMAYSLTTELLVSEKVAQRFEKRKAKKEKKQQTISGFAIHQGRMIANVKVMNNRSKDEVLTDQNGRYRIPIDDGDVLTFSKEGYAPVNLRIGDKPTLNVIMKPEQ